MINVKRILTALVRSKQARLKRAKSYELNIDMNIECELLKAEIGSLEAYLEWLKRPHEVVKPEKKEELDMSQYLVGAFLVNKDIGSVWKIIKLVPKPDFPILAHVVLESAGEDKETKILSLKGLEKYELK